MRLSMALALLGVCSASWAAPKAAKKAPAKATSAPAPSAAAEVPLPDSLRLPASTAAATAEDLLARFEAFDRDLKSLSASFRQSVAILPGAAPKTVEGRVEFLAPSRLRIEHEKPEKQTVVSDGKKVWIYRPAYDQAVQTDLEDWKKADPVAGSLLDFGSYGRMMRGYDMAVASAPLSLTLKPKDKSKADFTLILRLGGATLFPSETELRVGETRVRTEYPEVRLNPALSEERFKFTPPPGADVFNNFKPPVPTK